MATQTRSAGTGANDASYGNYAWSNPGNITSSNNTYATTSNPTSSLDPSNYLKATNFGFSIPSGSTINGITVSIERKSQVNVGSWYDVDNRVRIVKADATIGTADKASGVTWSDTEGVYNYGGSADLWSLSWTNTDINDTDFGVVLSVVSYEDNIGPGAIAYVDHIEITVDYTPPPSTSMKATIIII